MDGPLGLAVLHLSRLTNAAPSRRADGDPGRLTDWLTCPAGLHPGLLLLVRDGDRHLREARTRQRFIGDYRAAIH